MPMRGLMGLGLGLALGAALLAAAPAFAANTIGYVGTYTDDKAKGIYALKWDAAAKTFISLGLQAEVAIPSFVAVSPSHNFFTRLRSAQRAGMAPGRCPAMPSIRPAGR